MLPLYSACIEWLFAAEAPDFADRIRAAARAGLGGVEFWFWRNKDIPSIEAALAETGLKLTSLVAEPMVPLTDPTCHGAFLEGLKESVDMARRLKSPVLIAQVGDDLPGRGRAEQRQAIIDCLGRAADSLAGSGVRLAIEPLNTLVDHVGYFLPSTEEGLDIVDAVGRTEIRLLYDIYHSAVMSEDIAAVLAGRVDRVAHVHLADTPGRHEPGSGKLDWQKRVDWLYAQGYEGLVGLEYKPRGGTLDSLAALNLSARGSRV
ncbi:TIM barrel protein [Methylovirgula sp. 4M-Z18]|uniref:TIM barrel protein n=1 Tax=Methylovirgula sp. 4M-Z18 TaxID=2293567 RepID=UPI000E2EEE29|nr:TIM barrel protein [Methylovirgula sp. 4M-Z18]RFB78902.1 hydroxypyruvate isomerase [Methylovirgula sp. 4M-Z18]